MLKPLRLCPAILLLCCSAHAAGGDNHLIGSLFMTPEQRDQLDATGHFNPDRPRQVAPGSIRFNGSVRRSSGRETAWLNGRRIGQIELPDEIGNARLSGDRLLVEGRERTEVLKAGESLNVGNQLARRRAQ